MPKVYCQLVWARVNSGMYLSRLRSKTIESRGIWLRQSVCARIPWDTLATCVQEAGFRLRSRGAERPDRGTETRVNRGPAGRPGKKETPPKRGLEGAELREFHGGSLSCSARPGPREHRARGLSQRQEPGRLQRGRLRLHRRCNRGPSAAGQLPRPGGRGR